MSVWPAWSSTLRRQKHGEKVEPANGPPPEDVSGQPRERLGFRRLSFRGVGSVRLEWQLVCLTGNLLKQFRSDWTPQLKASRGPWATAGRPFCDSPGY